MWKSLSREPVLVLLPGILPVRLSEFWTAGVLTWKNFCAFLPARNSCGDLMRLGIPLNTPPAVLGALPKLNKGLTRLLVWKESLGLTLLAQF